MSLSDDRWRDSYDAWKLASPDDDRPYDECDHVFYEIDYEGRAHCDECGQSWWASEAEIEAQRVHQIEYDRWCEREARRLWWSRQFDRLAFWRQWRKPSPISDDLPF